METSQVHECLKLITSAMVIYEDAKKDKATKIKSALETYEFSDAAGKALVQIAKAKVAGKMDAEKQLSDELAAIIEIVNTTGTES